MQAIRMALWVALLMFGAVAATARPSRALSSSDCDDSSGTLCYTEEKDSCTRTVICGFSFPFNVTSCCAKRELTIDYYYWDSGGGGGGDGAGGGNGFEE